MMKYTPLVRRLRAPTTSAYSPEAAMDAPSMTRKLLPSGEAAFTAA